MRTIHWHTKDIATVEGFLSTTECADWIALSEADGYQPATINGVRGAVMLQDVRNNDRVIRDDGAAAMALFERLHMLLPETVGAGYAPVGLNERIRLYRYDPGQKFDWHRDGYYDAGNGQRSVLTFMVYLNEGFEGGGTSFSGDGFTAPHPDDRCIVPKAGMALLFRHPLVHRGDTVISGRKYVLRSDVMCVNRG